MSRYLNYIHNLRGLAILFVVGVHAGGYNSDWKSNPEVRQFLQAFFDPSEGNGTVLFLFIGGFLFQYLSANSFSYGKFLEQKFFNVILPYIVISIPLIVLRMNTAYDSLTLPAGFHDRPIVYQFMHHLLTGSHMPPFWFISTIILFYLTSPILHWLDRPLFYKIGLPIVLAVSLFTYRPEHNANTFFAYIHFLPVYIAGMAVSRYRQEILSRENLIFNPLILIYLSLTVLELSGNLTLSREITFEHVMTGPYFIFNIYMFKALVLCLLLVVLFYKLRSFQMSFLEVLGHYSFGVFFVHYLLISVTRKMIGIAGGQFDFTLPSYLIFFVFVVLASMVSVFLVKKVAGKYSRYLIGS